MEMGLLTLFSRRDAGKRVGLYDDNGEIRAAVVDGYPERGGRLVGFLRADSAAELDSELHRLGARKAEAHLVLSPDDYQLFQIERPEVADDEVRQALRWRISEMLAGRFVDPVIDWIELSGQTSAGRPAEVMVVAACRTAIGEGIERVKQTGLRLASIGVVPLALRDLVAAADKGPAGYVFLQVGDAGGMMIVGRQRRFYFSREVALGLDELSSAATAGGEDRADTLSDLALEIQRSLDYYDSHFRDSPVRDLWIACERPAVSEMLVEFLSESLDLAVQRFEPASTALETDAEVAADEGDLVALGAALRQPATRGDGDQS